LLEDVLQEAERILAAASGAKVTTRLLGGVAVAKHIHEPLPPPLCRSYGDIDVIVSGKEVRRLREVLIGLGYEANRPFNSLHGDRRMQFFDLENNRHLDVLVDVFEMCHKLDGVALTAHPLTLAPADLLLTKLQVVQVTEKDLIDSSTLLYQHEVRAGAGDVIDLDRLTDVARKDWGWYTTIMDNLARLDDFVAGRLTPPDSERILKRVEVITSGLETAPKSIRWKARASVGRRVPWYVLPEEPNAPA
jgi:hypothetical protein